MLFGSYIQYFTRFLQKKGNSPLYLTFFVTRRCNASCAHCFFTPQNNENVELNISEIESLSKNMGNFLFLLLTGGEPFLRRDLPEIASCFYRNNRVRNIACPTNGILTDTILEQTREILKKCPDVHLKVNVSLDGKGEGHDNLRNVQGCYDRAVETLDRLKNLSQKFPNLNTGVIMTLHRKNQNALLDLYIHVRDTLKPHSIALNLIRGNPADPDLLDVDPCKYGELAELMEADIISQRVTGYSGFPFSETAVANSCLVRQYICRTLDSGEFQMPCYAGSLSAVIYPDGAVSPCELLDDIMGNLRERNYNFREIWESKNAEKIRGKIEKTRCFCTHECSMTMNTLFNLRFLGELLKKSAVIMKNRKKTDKGQSR